MMILATNSNLQDVGNKIITIGMPILISLAVVIGIIMVAYYAIGGKFAKNADQRKETISRIIMGWRLLRNCNFSKHTCFRIKRCYKRKKG